MKWRKPDQGTCQSRGYTEDDTCRWFTPKSERQEVIDEVMTWSRDGDQYMFPRGDLGKLDNVFSRVPIKDMRVAPKLGYALAMKDHIQLRPDQQQVLDKWLSCGYGIVHAPTGWGKTVLMCALFAKVGVKILVLAEKDKHLQVVKEGLETLTNINELELEAGKSIYGYLNEEVVIKIDGDRRTKEVFGTVHPITLATYQAFNSERGKKLLPELTNAFGMVWHEEAHHQAAETFHAATKSFNPWYRGGQTATITRGDKLHIVTYDTIGPVTARATATPMTPTVQFMHTGVHVPDRCFTGQFAAPQVINYLAKDKDYFDLIVDTICQDFEANRKVLVYSMRKTFNAKLERALHFRGYAVSIIDGNSQKIKGNKKTQEWYSERLLSGELNGIIGTSIVAENFNVPPLDCVHLPFPNFTKELEIQIVGRIIRDNVPNKPQPLIRPYIWEAHQSMAHAAASWRRRVYKDLGYTIQQDKHIGANPIDLLEGI